MMSVLLVCGAVSICGCNKPNPDTEKVDALSKKLDLILEYQALICTNQASIFKNQSTTYSNQTVIFNEVDAVKTRLDSFIAFDVQGVKDDINAETVRIAKIQGSFIFTNLAQLQAGQSDMQRSLSEIQSRAESSDVTRMKVDVESIQDDLTKIKSRLGVSY